MPKPKKRSAAEQAALREWKYRLRVVKQVNKAAISKAEGKTVLKKAKTTRRNRILAKAAPDDARNALARVRARGKARAFQYAAALKAAKIGKRDWGKVVIFDTFGKRYRDFSSVPAKLKIYMVMVGPRGGLRLINPIDPDTVMFRQKGQPLPLTPRDFRFDKLAKIAPKKFRETMQETMQKSAKTMTREQLKAVLERTAPIDIGKGGDIETFYDKAATAYVNAVRSMEDLTNWGFDILMTLRGETKPVRVTTQQIPAHNFFKVLPQKRNGRLIAYRNHNTSPKALKLTIRYHVNELVRGELRVRGMVSQGSATRISRLPHNKGLAKKDWRDKNGARWNAGGLKQVSIRRIQFRLFRIL